MNNLLSRERASFDRATTLVLRQTGWIKRMRTDAFGIYTLVRFVLSGSVWAVLTFKCWPVPSRPNRSRHRISTFIPRAGAPSALGSLLNRCAHLKAIFSTDSRAWQSLKHRQSNSYDLYMVRAQTQGLNGDLLGARKIVFEINTWIQIRKGEGG